VVAVHPLLLPETASARGVLGPLAATTATAWALAGALAARRRRGGLVVVALATAVGLGFSPAAAVVPLVLLLVAWSGVAGPPAPWRWPVLVSAAVVAAALALALAAGAGPGLPRPGWGASAAAVRDLVAGFAGGPWSWVRSDAGVLQPLAPPAAGVAAGALVALALLVAAARRPGRLARTLPGALLWALVAWALQATSGAVLALTLGAALALLPRRVDAPPAWAGAARHVGTPARRLLAALAPVGLVLAVAWAGSALVAGSAAGRVAAAAPNGPWLAAVRASVAELPPFPRVLPRPVPDAVAAGATLPLLDAPLVRLLRPDVLLHDADGPALALDDSGRLGAAVTNPVAGTLRGGLCVADAQPGVRDVTWAVLPRPAPPARGALTRLELLVTGTTRVEVSVRTAAGTVTVLPTWSADLLYQGPHTVVHPVPPGTAVAAVGLRPLAPDAGLCVVAAEVVVPR
jgi:hypothetical protein